jgi:AcrR family transcriptional regulator
MSAAARRSPADVRNDIVSAAWDLFRQLGVHTTVADVAERLGMSSANIYRFFPSKQALTDAVCASQLAALTETARAAATQPGPGQGTRPGDDPRPPRRDARADAPSVAGARNRRRRAQGAMAGDRRLCRQLRRDRSPLVIADGQARGEFGSGDPMKLAFHTLFACVAVYHPTLIAQRTDVDPAPEDAVDFVLRALAASGERRSERL